MFPPQMLHVDANRETFKATMFPHLPSNSSPFSISLGPIALNVVANLSVMLIIQCLHANSFYFLSQEKALYFYKLYIVKSRLLKPWAGLFKAGLS